MYHTLFNKQVQKSSLKVKIRKSKHQAVGSVEYMCHSCHNSASLIFSDLLEKQKINLFLDSLLQVFSLEFSRGELYSGVKILI